MTEAAIATAPLAVSLTLRITRLAIDGLASTAAFVRSCRLRLSFGFHRPWRRFPEALLMGILGSFGDRSAGSGLRLGRLAFPGNRLLRLCRHRPLLQQYPRLNCRASTTARSAFGSWKGQPAKDFAHAPARARSATRRRASTRSTLGMSLDATQARASSSDLPCSSQRARSRRSSSARGTSRKIVKSKASASPDHGGFVEQQIVAFHEDEPRFRVDDIGAGARQLHRPVEDGNRDVGLARREAVGAGPRNRHSRTFPALPCAR